MINMPSKFLPLLLLASTGFLSPCLARKKILCLHGGGGTGEGFAGEMRELEQALPDFEFVYANGGYPVDGGTEFGKPTQGGYLWIPDPPGGKGEPTTDPFISDASIAALDELRANEGPFDGILGYSQGAAYVPVYLSRVPENTFEFALSFCGYPTETHIGILDRVEEMSPFNDISSLIWIGEQDFVIPNSLTRGTIPFYTSPVVIESSQGGHEVPGTSDPTFDQVVSFIASHAGDSAPVPSPVSIPSPTLRPVASPVASPTPFPTESEDKEDDDDKEEEPCEDSEIYRFKGKDWKTCEWIGKKLRRSKRLCKRNGVRRNCPETCGVCA